jgi:branched-chain amino acid transport system ATP-binding protein
VNDDRPLLELDDLSAHYGQVQALRGISLHVDRGEIVALLGPNGAGKSTTLRTIVGLLHPSAGDIRVSGESITRLKPHKVVTRGVALVPEGRRIFPNLSVAENLRMGGYLKDDDDASVERDIFELFPVLGERASQQASSLSGGEQQMLAIGRALMSGPTTLLLDEPSLGLAPVIARNIFRTIEELSSRGVTVLLVEQNARQALRIAKRAYVLEVGRIVQEGLSSDLMQDDSVRRIYLGMKTGRV